MLAASQEVLSSDIFPVQRNPIPIIQDADEHEDIAEPNQASSEKDDQKEEEPAEAESDKDKGENEKARSRRVIKRLLVYLPGERYSENCMTSSTRFCGGSIMIWGGICLGHRTELITYKNVSITAQRYCEDIAESIVIPFASRITPEFVFVDDNARPHRAAAVQRTLENARITRMNWLARSPDMNPIEHLWDHLQKQLSKREDNAVELDNEHARSVSLHGLVKIADGDCEMNMRKSLSSSSVVALQQR
ncbi:hypothetical protein ILUMI_13927 [Ignelater luminosus]|uniref:Tc1-like transposase DDE domain-containing protein n=1 Tax=Ignelater luminosus TaxID=2038154 RepID=A0A8K0GAY7_IGNLU|nr:hypothetical protein ILUMI_13927 [Ignelater luminosus]